MRRFARLALLAAIGLTGCSLPDRPMPMLPLPETGADAGVVLPRTSGPVDAVRRAPEPAISSTGGLAVGPGRRAAAPAGAARQGEFTLNFVDADIREIAATVLGTMLEVDYAIDPAVKGTGTIRTARPLARDQLLPTLQTVLSQNGVTLVIEDGLYRVLPTATAAGSAVLGSGASSAGAEIVSLRYAAAKDLATVLQPFVADGGKVSADPTRNALVVSGDPAARTALVNLIRAFDIDVLADQSYAIFPVEDGDLAKLSDALQKALGSDPGGPLAGILRVIPMERINAVLVVSTQPRHIDDARRLFTLIERTHDATARSWEVYYVQNGQSSDLERVLQRAFTPGRVTADRGAPGETAPGLTPVTMNQGTPGQAGQGQSGSSSIGSNGAGRSLTDASSAAQPAAGGATPATDSLSAPTGEGDANQATTGMRIIANRTNNALLIYATRQEHAVLAAMLRKLDILPLQVRIDATIAEVTLNDALQYGTQFFLRGGNGLQELLTTATTVSIPGALPGFVLSKTGSATQATLSALQSVTDVRVLSSPQVMVADNQPARLQVGDLVPYITQTAVSTIQAGSPVVNSIDYRETGVILQVIPRVNTGGLVSLEIAQEVSDVQRTNSSGIDSPTFLERKVSTKVVVQDGQTVGLAGLIRDNVSEGNAGFPFLKDIPILGTLLSTQTNTRARTELLVLITPHVIHDQRDARTLTQDLRETLRRAGLVPQQLQAKPASGLANPNAEAMP